MSVVIQSILWSILGAIAYRERIVARNTPRLLGRSLYWIGVPLQIFFLARKSNFDEVVWLPPVVTILVLFMGLALTLLALSTFKQLFKQKFFSDDSTEILSLNQLQSSLVKVESASLTTKDKFYQTISLPTSNTQTGSFIIASVLCNTGFVDLVLIPPLVDFKYWSWIILYGVVHNIVGSYGLGVLIADRYSYGHFKRKTWLNRIQNIFLLPSLWAFVYGYMTKDLLLPNILEIFIAKGVLFVVPGAFVLIGMQLGTLQQWQNLCSGIFPAILKILIIPGSVGLLLTLLGIRGDARLVLVLMSGMPTAFASVILAEEYSLDRQIVASSILLSTLFLPIVILFWLIIF